MLAVVYIASLAYFYPGLFAALNIFSLTILLILSLLLPRDWSANMWVGIIAITFLPYWICCGLLYGLLLAIEKTTGRILIDIDQ
ncbi:MAG: hypothetical protein HOP20_04510 [Sulfuriferula sp.]|nr:hypothetical protein [Sulfuriferula sp.]